MIGNQISKGLVSLSKEIETGWSVDSYRHYLFTMKNMSSIVKNNKRY